VDPARGLPAGAWRTDLPRGQPPPGDAGRGRGVRLKRPAASITADLPALADEYDARWLIADYAAGDVVVHTAHLVHAALDNVDPDGVRRLSTDIRYQNIDDEIDARWGNHWTLDDML
jgi:hypothetical protein